MPSSTRAADEVVSPTEATRRRIAKDPLSVQCCCCQAALVVKIVSIITFLLGGVLGVGGVFLNQQTANWELQTVDLLGWLCMFTGGFLVATSLLGLSAARSGSWLFLFAYFMMLLLLLASMLLACVYAYYENARLRQYITANWTAIQARLGFGEWIGGDDGEFTLDDAIEMVRTYLLVLGGTAAAITAMLLTAFLATMRMLGVRAITVCLLLCLGLLGGGAHAYAHPPTLSARTHTHTHTHTHDSPARAPAPRSLGHSSLGVCHPPWLALWLALLPALWLAVWLALWLALLPALRLALRFARPWPSLSRPIAWSASATERMAN